MSAADIVDSIAISFRAQALKAQARRLYLDIARQSDGFSCGAHLAEFIRPSLRAMKDEFNETMRQLAELDPAAAAVIEKDGPL